MCSANDLGVQVANLSYLPFWWHLRDSLIDFWHRTLIIGFFQCNNFEFPANFSRAFGFVTKVNKTFQNPKKKELTAIFIAIWWSWVRRGGVKGMKRRCTVGSGYIVVHGRNAHVCTRPGGTLSHWKLLFTFSHLSRRRIGLQSEKILYYSLYLIENWEIIGVIFPLFAFSGKIILFSRCWERLVK